MSCSGVASALGPLLFGNTKLEFVVVYYMGGERLVCKAPVLGDASTVKSWYAPTF